MKGNAEQSWSGPGGVQAQLLSCASDSIFAVARAAIGTAHVTLSAMATGVPGNVPILRKRPTSNMPAMTTHSSLRFSYLVSMGTDKNQWAIPPN